MGAPGKIACIGFKLGGMPSEILDVSDLVALGCCALTPQFDLL